MMRLDIGVVADLRRERALEVFVAAAAELLVAGRPVMERPGWRLQSGCRTI